MDRRTIPSLGFSWVTGPLPPLRIWVLPLDHGLCPLFHPPIERQRTESRVGASAVFVLLCKTQQRLGSTVLGFFSKKSAEL